MCGIAGLTGFDIGEDLRHMAMKAMLTRMANRGPEAEGIYALPGAATLLGHRRLAILDLDARSNQPMLDAGGRYAIVFNGEIYNFRELRAELLEEGVAFFTDGDTEVLLALYKKHGEEMLPKLRGMFAFAIHDKVEDLLFLARDPYGIKPLYWTAEAGGFAFASQVKALAASELIDLQRSAAGLVGFLLWGSVQEPHTWYNGVYALPAGHAMVVRKGIPEASREYVCLPAFWHQAHDDVSDAELLSHIRETLEQSVQAHLVADVPVGLFLSGGVDSGVLAGWMQALGVQVEGVTVAFDEFANASEDEAGAASQIARHYGVRHHVRRVGYQEFVDDLPAILDAMDQPSIDGVNTWFASKAVAERGYKVVLSGIGGDEILAGYPSFERIPKLIRRMKMLGLGAARNRALAATVDAAGQLIGQPKAGIAYRWGNSMEGAYFAVRGLFAPAEVGHMLGEEVGLEGLERLGWIADGDRSPRVPAGRDLGEDPSGAVAQLESTQYLRNQLLRDSDWASMAHSLELRTPFVDLQLARELAPYTNRFRKGQGKKLLGESAPNPMPEAVMQRPKTGFSIPMQAWMRRADLVGRSNTEHWSRGWARTLLALNA